MADILTPAPGDEIVADWGASVAAAINGIQAGTTTVPISSAATIIYAVTFPKAYKVAPAIQATSGPGNGNKWVAAYTNVTTSGFGIVLFARDGVAGTANVTVSWLAIGELA